MVVEIGLARLNLLWSQALHIHAHVLIPGVVESGNRRGGSGQSLVSHRTIRRHDRNLLGGGSRGHLLLPLMHHTWLSHARLHWHTLSLAWHSRLHGSDFSHGL